jgi:uncharacterized protein (TIRG00374 family)
MSPPIRRLLTLGIVIGLAIGIWTQRSLLVASVQHVPQLGLVAALLIVGLIVGERLARAWMMRHAVGQLTHAEGFVVHDVGAAASYGLPAGGAIGAGLRYQIVRTAGVRTEPFLAGVTVFGIAMAASSWLLPALFLVIELATGRGTAVDGLLLGLTLLVPAVAGLTWWSLLCSDRVFGRVTAIASWGAKRAGRRIRVIRGFDVSERLASLRTQTRTSISRLPALLIGAVAAQVLAAAILFVALRALTPETRLDVVEFGQVFFLTRVVSSLAPTPGGVGAVETGLTASLVMLGVDAPAALASVVVYRLATFVVPIATGLLCWMVWHRRSVAAPDSAEEATVEPVTGLPSTATVLPSGSAVVRSR